jgi:hypothetical protein
VAPSPSASAAAEPQKSTRPQALERYASIFADQIVPLIATSLSSGGDAVKS